MALENQTAHHPAVVSQEVLALIIWECKLVDLGGMRKNVIYSQHNKILSI